MNIKEQLLERIKAAEVTGRYMTYSGMGIEEVRCKGCETPLRHLAPDDRFQEMRSINGKQVMCERLTLITLPAYVEVKMSMSDDSFHVTCVCKECADKLTADDLESLYCHDVNEMLHDGTDAPDSFWEMWLNRKPTETFVVYPPGVIAF